MCTLCSLAVPSRCLHARREGGGGGGEGGGGEMRERKWRGLEEREGGGHLGMSDTESLNLTFPFG